MALTAAEMQKRHELEGAPDPFPSLAPTSPVRPKVSQPQNQAVDTDSQILFPSLAPSPAASAANTTAPAASAWGNGPRIKPTVVKAPTYSDSITLTNINLTVTNKDGTHRQTTLAEVMKQVMARYKVKIDASANQRTRQHTFHLKSESESELDKAKKNLVAWLSPNTKSIVNAPASTIPTIIGSKGSTLKQIREQTSVRIDIPPKDSITNGSASGTATPSQAANNDEEEEIMVPITVEGAAPFVEEAVALINAIIANRVARSTQRVKDVPAHVLPFVASHKANFEGMAESGSVSFISNAADREITISGDRDAVNRVVESVKATIEGFKKSLTSIKMTLPKRQHRLLQGAAVDELLAKSKCTVITAAPEEVSDEIVVWGQGSDLPGALAAVIERANSQHIHEFPLPGPISFSRQLLAYMTRIDYPTTLCTNHWGVSVYTPHPSVIEKASILNIDIVGEKADVDAVVRQISELIGKLLGGIRGITIDWLLHRVITGKHAKKIKEFHSAHNVSVYFPPEDAEKSEVLLVYDPFSPSASLSPDEKAKHLEDVSAELLKMAKEVADVKSKTISVEKRWHDAVLGQNGTTLNAIIGEEKALSIKLGAEVGDSSTEDIILIRGVSSDVERAAKEILKIVEDAKNDVIVSSYSTEVEVDREYIGRIVGAQGAGINKLRDQLGVKIDVADDGDDKKKKATSQKSKITITGRKENAEEAKRRILAQVERLADETQEVLKIPAQYHASLIGQSGKYAIRLEEKYAVKITFPRQSNNDGGEGRTREQLKPDEVLIKGGKRGVAGAKSELVEALEFEKESNNVIRFTVPQRAVARILGKNGAQINEIKDETDAQIDIDKPGTSDDPELAKITVRGTKKAVAAAQSAIKAIADQVAEETTVNVTVDQKYHRTIIGAGGQGLKDLVAKCGGPSDSRLQAGLIRFPRQGDDNMDEVRLRGDAKLVNKIKAELEKIVKDLNSRVVLATEIPAAQHRALIGRGGQHLNELQNKHGVQIQFPGSRSYNQVGEAENAAELESVDPANIVKVSGPRPACEKAIQALKSQIKPPAPEAITAAVTVPFKYHHAVLQQGAFLRGVRSYGVTVDMSAQPKQPAVPSHPPSNGNTEARIDDLEDTSSGVSWEVIPNYQNAEEGSATWTLKARDQAGLDKAKTAIQDAIAHAERMSHIGFLTLSDRSSFPRIVGAKGSNVARLRDETGADITVSKENNTIVIVGAESDILAAKDAILAISSRPRRD